MLARRGSQVLALTRRDAVRLVLGSALLVAALTFILAFEDLSTMTLISDLVVLAGWFIFSAVLVSLLMAWLWRFRSRLWHRNNAITLIALTLIVATVSLVITAGGTVAPFVVPTAAVGPAPRGPPRCRRGARRHGARGCPGRHHHGLHGAHPVHAHGWPGRHHRHPPRGAAGAVRSGRGRHRRRQLRRRPRVHARPARQRPSGLPPARGGSPRLGARCSGGGGWDVRAPRAASSGSRPATSSWSSPTRRSRCCAACSSRHPARTTTRSWSATSPSRPPRPSMRTRSWHGWRPTTTTSASSTDPGAFIENQAGRENLHDELPPDASAAIVAGHVARGIDIAYRTGCPRRSSATSRSTTARP